MENIDAKKITKPIQLLAAWLVGLVSVNATFLIAALKLTGWESASLVIASIINVPVFLFSIFMLQTKFRPELQEDTFYSLYLNNKTNKLEKRIRRKDDGIVDEKNLAASKNNKIETIKMLKISINDYLLDFMEIKSQLKELEIPVYSSFGKINGTKDPPKQRVVSIATYINIKTKTEFLKLLFYFNFDGYNYMSTYEPDIIEDVLIGSYNHRNQYCPFNKELKDLLDSEPDEIDYRYYEGKYLTKKDEE